MLKTFYVVFFLFIPFFSSAEGKDLSKKFGYKYIIDNYFSKRASSGAYYFDRKVSFYTGFSFYENSFKGKNSHSSLVIGFNQKIREIKKFGDWNLQISGFSLDFNEEKKSFLLEVQTQISFPEMSSHFPAYVGAGLGFGFYPASIIDNDFSSSLSANFFFGLRFLNLYHNIGLSSEAVLRFHSPRLFDSLKIYQEVLVYVALIFGF